MGFLNKFFSKFNENSFKMTTMAPYINKNMFKDPVIEGKKSGYSIAAEEYEVLYSELRDEYKKHKNFFEAEMSKSDSNLDIYINKLQLLEKEYKELQQLLKTKKRELQDNYCTEKNISKSAGILSVDVYGFFYKRKFKKAEADGYIEAKAIYKRKLSALKGQLTKLIRKSESELSEHKEIISETQISIVELISKISQIKLDIAEIDLLL